MTGKTDDDEVTEAQDETPEPDDSGDDDHDHLTLANVAEKLDSLAGKVDALVKGGLGRSRPTKADGAADVGAQVKAEVEKIRAAEARQKAREDRIGALETKVAEITEAPPREYRRVTRIMWGEDE